MQIRTNGLIDQVNGKIGNLTAFSGRIGTLVRQIVIPRNPQSAGQVGVRAWHAYAASAWAGMTDSDRIAWNTAALEFRKTNALGDKYSSTGFNLFMAVNDTAQFMGQSTFEGVPPALTAPTNNGNLANEDFTGGVTQTATIDIPLVSAGDILVIYATAQLSQGRYNFKGRFRPIKYCTAGAAQVGYDIYAEYTAVFGTLVTGKKLALKCQYYNIAGGSPRVYLGGPELGPIVK